MTLHKSSLTLTNTAVVSYYTIFSCWDGKWILDLGFNCIKQSADDVCTVVMEMYTLKFLFVWTLEGLLIHAGFSCTHIVINMGYISSTSHIYDLTWVDFLGCCLHPKEMITNCCTKTIWNDSKICFNVSALRSCGCEVTTTSFKYRLSTSVKGDVHAIWLLHATTTARGWSQCQLFFRNTKSFFGKLWPSIKCAGSHFGKDCSIIKIWKVGCDVCRVIDSLFTCCSPSALGLALSQYFGEFNVICKCAALNVPP